ncbi:MAG: flagellar motor protein MotB [Candidatus Marinimicrobia bacterium]|nr:flagellar motor protein MotB [Candidatus Neomarinimicrobiota bacterium]
MAASPQEKKKFIKKGMGLVEEGLPGWFGTFADMMTLLFAFFVLLAAISTIDPVKLMNMADGMGKSVGKKKEIENQAMSLGDIQKEAQKMVEEMAVDPETGEKPVEVTTSPKGVTIGISSDISFRSGSADTKPEFLDILKKIIPTIEKSYFQIAVEGHTDSDQLPKALQVKYPSNWELSGARAAAVVRLMISLGIGPTRLEAVGYGEFVPRDRKNTELLSSDLVQKYNSNPQQKARNRRVEITFLAPRGGPVGRTEASTENG